MANPQHLEKLKQGVTAWNQWRNEHPTIKPDFYNATLTDANLSHANLRSADFSYADLRNADLSYADLRKANLSHATLFGARLTHGNLFYASLFNTDLRNATLSQADLPKADLSCSDIRNATLSAANLTLVNLTGSDLRGAILTHATLVETTVTDATFTGCKVYGISVWNLQGEPREQHNLVITREWNSYLEPTLAVDNLEVAQFIYMLTEHEKLRNVIDTMTTKAVLILGRFSDEREPTLHAIMSELRQDDYIPIIFDFDKPDSTTFVTTISTIARMVRFVVADFTDPKMVPVEVQHIADTGAAVPILPIRMSTEKEEGEHPVLIGLRRTHGWMILDTFWYDSTSDLITSIKDLIEPAKAVAQEAIQGDRERSEKIVQAIREKRQRGG